MAVAKKTDIRDALPDNLATDKSEPTQTKPRQVQPPRVKESGLSFSPDGNHYLRIEYNLPPGHSYEDVKMPAYWHSASHRFKKGISTDADFVGSIICLRPVDNSFYAERFITAINSGGVVTEELLFKTFGPQPGDKELESKKFRYQWNPQYKGYDIVRNVDNAIVAKGSETKTLSHVAEWLKTWDK